MNTSNDSNKEQKALSEFSDDSLKEIAKEVVVKRSALLIHAILYLCVHGLLVGINYGVNKFEAGINDVWALWSISGWGIGLLIHVLYYIIFKKGIVNYSTIAVLYHLGVFVIVQSYLIFIDWVVDFNAMNWSYWPLITWGPAVIAHIILVFVFLPMKEKRAQAPKKEKVSWMDKQINKELDKIKKRDA